MAAGIAVTVAGMFAGSHLVVVSGAIVYCYATRPTPHPPHKD